MKLYWSRLRAEGVPPRRAYVTDAGWDLFSPYDFVLTPGELHKVNLGVAIWFGGGIGNWYGRIAEKSGPAMRGLQILGGVIDAGYRGEIGVVLRNGGPSDIVVVRGNAIAQIIPERILTIDESEEGVVGETERGSAGWGSGGTI